MKKILILISTFILISCNTATEQQSQAVEQSSQSIAADPPIEKKEPVGKDSSKIQLHFETVENMNMINGEPSPIEICIYEMNEKYVFASMALSDKEKREKKLTKCSAFDKSINKVSTLTVAPGEEAYFVIDRNPKLRHLGVVAKYSDYIPKNALRLYGIPSRKKIPKGWQWVENEELGAEIVTIDIKLGAFGINKKKKR